MRSALAHQTAKHTSTLIARNVASRTTRLTASHLIWRSAVSVTVLTVLVVRDAVTGAATLRTAKSDLVALARRVVTALNAPYRPGLGDFGFFG